MTTEQEFYHHGAAFATTQPSASAGQLTFGGGVSGSAYSAGRRRSISCFYGNAVGHAGHRFQWQSDVLRPTPTPPRRSAEHVQGHRHEQRIVVGVICPVVRWSERRQAREPPSNASFVPYQQKHPLPVPGTTTRRLRRLRPLRPSLAMKRSRPRRISANTTAASNVTPLRHPVAAWHQPGQLPEYDARLLRMARLHRRRRGCPRRTELAFSNPAVQHGCRRQLRRGLRQRQH